MKTVLVMLLSLLSIVTQAQEWYHVKAHGIVYPLSAHAVQRMHERDIALDALSNLLAHGTAYKNTPSTQLIVNTNTGYGAVITNDARLVVTVMNRITKEKLERKLLKLLNQDPQILKQKDIVYLKHTAIIPPTEKSTRKKFIKSMNSRKGDEPYTRRSRAQKKVK
jgi:hypothetical protein